MAINLAWPREDVYGEGALAWIAFIFIGALVVIGLGWYLTPGAATSWARCPSTWRSSWSSPRDAAAPPARAPEVRVTGAFDYVVVGGGSSGCALAARLSEDPAVTVCLLEAGPSDVDDPAILRLEDWMGLLDSGYDWDYLVEPQAHGNSFLRHARARVLGGCSSHNSCIAFWTPREDLDEWAANGCTGWSADECWPLIKRLETNDGEWEGHGRSGPVNLRQIPPDDPCGVAVLEAAAAVGMPTVRFNEGRDRHRRRGVLPDQRGRRQHPHVLLARVPAPHHGDAGRTWRSAPARGRRRSSSRGRRATGVEYQQRHRARSPDRHRPPRGDPLHRRRGHPQAADALGHRPVGEHLREMGLDVLVDSPGVGANLDDHVEGLVMWEAARPMVTTLHAVVGDRAVRPHRGRAWTGRT